MNRDYSTDLHSKGSQHLTSEQMGELLDATLERNCGAELSAARAHLESCEACRSEFDSLREAVALFRESTTAFANQQFTSTKQKRVDISRMLSHPATPFSPSLVWIAAGLLVGATLLPLRFHQQQQQTVAAAASTARATPDRSSKGESDAALLDDINRELSASVPDSMEPLAEPASSSRADVTSPIARKN